MDQVIRFWIAQCGVRHRLQAYDPRLLSIADSNLAELFASTTSDAARSFLSSLSQREPDHLAVRVLTDVLIERCLQELDQGVPTKLTGWTQLTAEFCGMAQYSADAHVLEGLSHSLREAASVAARHFSEALESYEALASVVPGLVVASALAAAEERAREDDMDGAKKLFDHASKRADKASASHALVANVRQKWNACWDCVSAISIGAERTVPSDAADVCSVLRSRTIRLLAKEQTDDALRVAIAADDLGTRIGRKDEFLRKIAEFALGRQRFAFAEKVGVALLGRGDGQGAILVAEAHLRAGRPSSAEQVARDILKETPNSAEAECLLGRALLPQNRLDAALSAFGRAVVLAPMDANAMHLLNTLSPGDIPGVSFDPAKGTMFIDPNALNGDPNLLAACMTAAMVRGNPSEAEGTLADIATEKDQEFMALVRQLLFPSLRYREEQSNFQKAEALFQAQRFDEAMTLYRHAIEDEPANNLAYMGIGDCYYQVGKYNLAVAYFEESIAVAPHVSTYRFLGDAHRRCGRLPLARQAYEAALELNPNYRPAREQLALMARAAEAGNG